MSLKSSFAIVVPCYNEEKAMPVFLAEVTNFFSLFSKELPDFTLKFIFVDNNSTDTSFRRLSDFAEKFSPFGSIQVVSCKTQGYGAALKTGFSATESAWYGFADLDNTYPLKDFPNMLKLALEKNLDIVFANRLQLKTDMPLIRKAGNLFYSYLSQILFQNSVQDMCTGMRVFKMSRRQKIVSLPSNDLKFSIEFTATTLKEEWPKAEIAIVYRERLGESKLSVVKDGILFLLTLLKVKFSHAHKES
ncbi:MAG: glycosyltransferase family 2 protein [Bdellovibrio sp.]|nr:glycosyltransferase family 2 protein [Bdellovibrio sp.]